LACSPVATIILVAEGNAGFVEAEDPTARDRDPMRVARQIGEHCLGSGKGWLCVDDPPLGMLTLVPTHRKSARMIATTIVVACFTKPRSSAGGGTAGGGGRIAAMSDATSPRRIGSGMSYIVPPRGISLVDTATNPDVDHLDHRQVSGHRTVCWRGSLIHDEKPTELSSSEVASPIATVRSSAPRAFLASSATTSSARSSPALASGARSPTRLSAALR